MRFAHLLAFLQNPTTDPTKISWFLSMESVDNLFYDDVILRALIQPF